MIQSFLKFTRKKVELILRILLARGMWRVVHNMSMVLNFRLILRTQMATPLLLILVSHHRTRPAITRDRVRYSFLVSPLAFLRVLRRLRVVTRLLLRGRSLFLAMRGTLLFFHRKNSTMLLTVNGFRSIMRRRRQQTKIMSRMIRCRMFRALIWRKLLILLRTFSQTKRSRSLSKDFGDTRILVFRNIVWRLLLTVTLRTRLLVRTLIRGRLRLAQSILMIMVWLLRRLVLLVLMRTWRSLRLLVLLVTSTRLFSILLKKVLFCWLLRFNRWILWRIPLVVLFPTRILVRRWMMRSRVFLLSTPKIRMRLVRLLFTRSLKVLYWLITRSRLVMSLRCRRTGKVRKFFLLKLRFSRRIRAWWKLKSTRRIRAMRSLLLRLAKLLNSRRLSSTSWGRFSRR